MSNPADTQSEWYTSTNPDVLLDALPNGPDPPRPPGANGPSPYERRRRLYAAACVRMVWNLLPTDARNAILLAERYAENQTTAASLEAAGVRVVPVPLTPEQHAINAAAWGSYAVLDRYTAASAPFVMHCDHWQSAREVAKALATRAAGPAPPGGNPVSPEWQRTWNTAYHAARAHQAELVRDIFPPPDDAIRSLRLERNWQTSTVLSLARQADQTGDYSVLPILADALQDAGCDNEFMLDRCRAGLRRTDGPSTGSPTPSSHSGIHCRGNWVVDLLLGRV